MRHASTGVHRFTLRPYASFAIVLALVGLLAGCGDETDESDLEPCTAKFVKLYNELKHLYPELKRPENKAPRDLLQQALATCDSFQRIHGARYVCGAKRDDRDVRLRAAKHAWFCWHVRYLARQPHPEWIVSQNSAGEPAQRSPCAPPT